MKAILLSHFISGYIWLHPNNVISADLKMRATSTGHQSSLLGFSKSRITRINVFNLKLFLEFVLFFSPLFIYLHRKKSDWIRFSQSFESYSFEVVFIPSRFIPTNKNNTRTISTISHVFERLKKYNLHLLVS